MANQTIMIMRHADKPDGEATGIDERGSEDSKSLIPRGWQRAGILAELFAPSLGQPPSLPTPSAIFASAPAGRHDTSDTAASKSKRPLQTVSPLAAKLGIQVDLTFSKGRERALAQDLATTAGVVLVCWQHEDIAAITSALAPDLNDVPKHWPSDRFNVILRFDRPAQSAAWSFQQVVPRMLEGDAPTGL